ncbi:MAG: serine/threonine protein kinase, partial [Candidatus Obscuribacterales bacterium]|nr:serine/threonine protein kinase [Candidatus Obscuribacterales bacterium]
MEKISKGDIFHGRYRILEQIGSGGMGVVYHAKQIDVERDVAIKILSNDRLSHDSDRERFLREFQILSQLSHKNIMGFYSLAITPDGVPYAVCEFIEGQNLSLLLQERGRLPWQMVLKIAIQIAEAVEFAHTHEIVHRDLKPSNVMITEKPDPFTVKLIDFGLARFIELSQSQRLTGTGNVVGSIHYMSPEQCMGKELSQQSDIYSLACLIFECLSGEKLFESESPLKVVEMQVKESPSTRLAILKTQSPPALLNYLEKMLAKSRKDRPESMKEVSSRLTELQFEPDCLPKAVQSNVKNKYIRVGMPIISILLLAVLTLFVFEKQKHARRALVKLDPLKQQLSHLPHSFNSLEEQAHGLQEPGDRIRIYRAWLNKYPNAPLLDRLDAETALSNCEYQLGNKAEVLKHGTIALSICDKLPSNTNILRERKCISLLNQFDYTIADGNLEKAKDYLNKAAEILQSADYDYSTNGVLVRTVEAYLGCGDAVKALKLMSRDSLQSLLKVNSLDYAESELLIADAYILQLDHLQAKTHYLKCLDGLEKAIADQGKSWSSKMTINIGADKVGGGPAASRVHCAALLADLSQRFFYLNAEEGKDLFRKSLLLSRKETEDGLKVSYLNWKDMAEIGEELNSYPEALYCAKTAWLTQNREDALDVFKLSFFLAKLQILSGYGAEAVTLMKTAKQSFISSKVFDYSTLLSANAKLGLLAAREKNSSSDYFAKEAGSLISKNGIPIHAYAEADYAAMLEFKNDRKGKVYFRH